MFDTILAAPPDSILGLTDAWKKDPNSLKVNLGVGVYKDASGNTPILASVKAAEAAILQMAVTKSYMPISGAPEYGAHVQELIFGGDHAIIGDGRARTAHTPGGTAALRAGGDFLKQIIPQATVWVSAPTWANHKGVFGAAGFRTADYPYYDAAGKSLDFARMTEVLETIPAGDIVLLHACCHNPSGVDLSSGQWQEVAAIAARRGWLPFLDFAYQGYGDGLEADRAGLLALAAVCPEFLVASSFSKNFGLYQDRTGGADSGCRHCGCGQPRVQPCGDRDPGELLESAGPRRADCQQDFGRQGVAGAVVGRVDGDARAYRCHPRPVCRGTGATRRAW